MPTPNSPLSATVAAYALGAQRFADRPDDRDWLRPLVSRFRSFLEHDDLVLDLGCASGRETVELVESGLRILGLDIVSSFLALARKRHPCEGYVLGTNVALPFRSGWLDGIWASASLLHLHPDDADVALAEARRVLKPGGVLYSSMQRGSSADWVECIDPEPGAVRYYRYYEPEEWAAKAERAGFEILRLDVKDWNPSNNVEATGWIEFYGRVSTRNRGG